MTTIPAALVGQAPQGYKQGYPRPLAWGPFMVEALGWSTPGAWLWQLDDDQVVWHDHDHEHVWPLTQPAEVEGDTLVLTTDQGVARIRPLTEAEDSLDLLAALHLA